MLITDRKKNCHVYQVLDPYIHPHCHSLSLMYYTENLLIETNNIAVQVETITVRY